MDSKKLLFRQLFDQDTGTYTYLLADKKTREAVIIDTIKSKVIQYLTLLRELDLDLKYILDTHIHADHITGAYDLKEETEAQIAIGRVNEVKEADIHLEDQDKLIFGDLTITAIATPGHTNGCFTYHVENMLFTGDVLLYRSTGRVDFQEGSAENLYNSIQKLFQYPENTLVCIGHNYAGLTMSTIIEEKKYNHFVNNNMSKKESLQKQQKRKLLFPKYISTAVPSNKIAGKFVIDDKEEVQE
jgi:sulfur dioxygenase